MKKVGNIFKILVGTIHLWYSKFHHLVGDDSSNWNFENLLQFTWFRVGFGQEGV
jgi:hypothetical protein